MITENTTALSVEETATTPSVPVPSFLTARSLVAPVAPAKWMGQWQPDDEAWKTAAKVAASS